MSQFKIGDIVWAKMASYPHWPSVIVEPNTDKPKPSQDIDKTYFWIFFFGSNNYSWIEISKLSPYEINREKYIQPEIQIEQFTEAVDEAEIHIAKRKSNRNYKVVINEKFKNKEIRKRSLRKYKYKKEVKKRLSMQLRSNIYENNNMCSSKGVLDTRKISTSKLVFGVLGIGIIGSGIVKNLVRSGHVVNIWNRTMSKCDEIIEQLGEKFKRNVQSFFSPRALLLNSDIVFVCVSTQEAANAIFQNSFGTNNPRNTSLRNKGIVQMTTTGPEVSKDLKAIIEKQGGKYLEAQIQGSKPEALEGNLLILAAGEESLFLDCQPCFKAIGKTATYLGDVGYASKLNLILQMCRGVLLAALAEGLSLAERWDVKHKEFLEIFSATGIASGYLKRKAVIILEKKFCDVEQSLRHLQRDLKLGLDLSNSEKEYEPMYLANTANEIFKHCRRLEYGEHDAAAIYMRNKH